MKMISKSVDIL